MRQGISVLSSISTLNISTFNKATEAIAAYASGQAVGIAVGTQTAKPYHCDN